MQTNLECCQNCIHYDEEWSDWDHKMFPICLLGVWFPVRKGTCKRQTPYNKRLNDTSLPDDWADRVIQEDVELLDDSEP